MWQKNKGQTESERLQNRFTAYLSRAIGCRRNEYLQQVMRRSRSESLTDNPVSSLEYYVEQDVFEELPLLMQLENNALLYALKRLNERERNIFLARVLDEKSFEELADILGISYSGAASIYYRAIRKIKNRMQEVEDEF